MKLDLMTLPQFNVTYITRCLTVSERLTVLAHVHPRFHDFVLQPQCFPDMSFFPVDTAEMSPKIISQNGSSGITYVEINIFSKHPFIQRVSMFAGMWNFNANLWNEMDWPLHKNIESLQLTLDYKTMTSQNDIYLDEPPQLNLSSSNDNEDVMMTPTTQPRLMQIESGDEEKWSLDFGKCISPTTKKPMDTKCKVRNLFFIKQDSNPQQQTIHFPKTLWGLGLQNFGSSIFASSWWLRQIEIEHRFESLRFLVLTYCEFENDELQRLMANTVNVEHVSLRFVKWEGSLDFGASVLSLGYFPERGFTGCYSIRKCLRLWQVSTRFNENEEAAADFLNKCSRLDSVRRVKFEMIKRERVEQMNTFLSSSMSEWDSQNDLQMVINIDDLKQYPIIQRIIGVRDENVLNWEQVRFEECPFWSEESKDFIHMTNKRKLLLR